MVWGVVRYSVYSSILFFLLSDFVFVSSYHAENNEAPALQAPPRHKEDALVASGFASMGSRGAQEKHEREGGLPSRAGLEQAGLAFQLLVPTGIEAAAIQRSASYRLLPVDTMPPLTSMAPFGGPTCLLPAKAA